MGENIPVGSNRLYVRTEDDRDYESWLLSLSWQESSAESIDSLSTKIRPYFFPLIGGWCQIRGH
jgi:hypothetical protein